jgi:hypothetical protein
MSIPALDARIRPLNSPRSPLTDALREASIAYGETSRDNFESVTPGLLAHDDVMLSALAERIAKLAKNIAETPKACNFVDARPDRAALLEHLSEIVIEAFGGPAGVLVRAHARIFAAG